MTPRRRKLKIGIVCPYDYYRPGGVPSHIAAEYDELIKLGYDVKIIAPKPTDNKVKKQKHVIFLGQSTAMKVNAPFHTMFDVSTVEAEDIKKMLAKEKFDLLHVHEPWLPVMPYRLINNTDTVVVGTLHATWPDTAFLNSLQKAITPYVMPALNRIDYLTAVSDAPAEKVKNISDKHINMIPNGINLSVFDPDAVEPIKKYQDDTPMILYLGRLEKRKGVEYLIKAYHEMRTDHHTDARLVIAGDGPKRKYLENYVERFEVPDVEFLGRVSDKLKLRLLKTCTLFCSPAVFGESFGIVLLEAMAMNAPIVAGYNSGYKTVMAGVGQLAMVDPKSQTEFARRLAVVLSSKEVRDMLVEWGRKEVKQYDFPRVIRQYDELFQEIANTNELGEE